jgi:hypothetical protein
MLLGVFGLRRRAQPATKYFLGAKDKKRSRDGD